MLEDKNQDAAADRSFSLLPKHATGAYQLAGDGYIFHPEDGTDTSPFTWYAMETSVPFVQQARCLGGCEAGCDWAGDFNLRASGTSPLMVIQHRLILSMICTYDVDGDQSKRVAAKLQFALPVQFARVKAGYAGNAFSGSHGHSQSTLEQPDASIAVESAGLQTPSSPYYYANTLPAYSQLFDANGERKIDYSLPVYTPPSHSSSSSTALLDGMV
jgi:hypothetical protein